MQLKKIIKAAIKYATKASYRFLIKASFGIYNNMPDEKYLQRKYQAIMQKPLNLKNPQAFSEKLQWLKLYDRKPEYTMMVDKHEVKKYVADKIGQKYIIPTLGVWDNFDEIDFATLPDQFVLKCTHDSGGLTLCRKKETFDINAAKTKITRSLRSNYYWSSREWPYKNVKPRIIAEQYMENKPTGSEKLPEGLVDYKFFCFHGVPKFIYISKGLEAHETARISFLTMDWEFAPYRRSDFAPFEELPLRPKKFEEMTEIAKVLSEGHAFLRVDLYEINGNVYFSELTFTPCAGMIPFVDPAHDQEIGDLLDLTKLDIGSTGQ